jgi:hypothetical protein
VPIQATSDWTTTYVDDPWHDWMKIETTTTCSTSYIWNTWVSTSTNRIWTSDTTATTVSGNTLWIWRNWVEEHAATIIARRAPPPETDAQRQERLEQQRFYAELRSKEQAERAEAERKAERLLVENLTLKQRLHYERHKAFIVRGHSGRLYRVRKGRSANVDVINPDGRVIDRLCFHPAMQVPDGDTMLAQKLMLELDDHGASRIANRHGVNRADTVPADMLH